MQFHHRLARYRAHSLFVLIALIGLAISFSGNFNSNAQKRSQAEAFLVGTITGRVFQDFNGNGTYDTAAGIVSIDTGVANVTVSAFDANGAACGSTLTDAAGNYTLNATGTGPYRVEFTTLPAGFTPSARSTDSVSGGSATDAGSTVQFIANGATPNVNLALDRYEEYCQADPTIVTPRFAQGASNGTYANNAVLYDFPYSSGTTYTDTTVANYDNPSSHTLTTKASAVGTIFGMAYNRLTNRIYAGSFYKRHAGFGPGADNALNTADDMGAIYVVNPATSAIVSTFTVPNVTVNSHQTNDYANDNADAGWDATGKTGLGGMALADDASRLFVMNLEDRKLYALDPTSGASLGSSASVTTLTLPTPGGTGANCSTGGASTNIRPFAVKYYRSQVYIGVVCTAESGGGVSNLYAYIFQVDPASLAITATPVYSVQLNYSRGVANPGATAAWNPWSPTISAAFAYAQPMVAGIEFQTNGIVLGLRDRSGDAALDAGPDAKRTAGDTLRSCGSFGAWTLESNGRCGGTGNGVQGTNQGPGGSEFYYQDDFCTAPNNGNFHDEVALGALLYVPGRTSVVASVFDPISRVISNGATFDGGFRYLNNTTGQTDRSYRMYNGQGGAGQPDFGKANGLGAMAAMCNPAPIEIGNRVWRDLNSNGVQDPGENGISGVTVHLFEGAVSVATAITDVNGEYYFVSSAAVDPNPNDSVGQLNGNIKYSTAYQVRFDLPANYSGAGPLTGLYLSFPDQTSQPGNDNASDSDAHSVTNPPGSPAGVFPVVNVTTGGPGTNDHTFDVGFISVVPTAADISVEGRVTLQAGNGVRNARVYLVEEDGTVHTTITGSFGYYRFDGIEAGQTVVVGVEAKRFSFSQPARAVLLADDLTEIDFVAEQ